MGFTLLNEVGNKNPAIDRAFSIEDRVMMINKELDAESWKVGKLESWKVIIEARESGTVGLFNTNGQI